MAACQAVRSRFRAKRSPDERMCHSSHCVPLCRNTKHTLIKVLEVVWTNACFCWASIVSRDLLGRLFFTSDISLHTFTAERHEFQLLALFQTERSSRVSYMMRIALRSLRPPLLELVGVLGPPDSTPGGLFVRRIACHFAGTTTTLC